MKTACKIFAVGFATVLFAGLARAQIQFVLVEKQVQFTQNSEAAPSLASGTPYSFHFGVVGGGTSISGLSPVEITTTAGGTVGSVVLSAGSNYNASDNEWKSDTAAYSSLTGAGSLDAAYANGVYALNINGTSDSLALGAGSGPYTDRYPSVAPMVTGLSAGDFDGLGRLKINLALSSYTFNINSASLTDYTSGGHIGAFLQNVSDGGGNVDAESMYFPAAGFSQTALTGLTFNPSTSNMVAGNTYTLELEFNLGTGAATNLFGGGSGELDMGLFTYRTQLTVIAIPEPSAYAAVFGVMALAGVMIHRRRRTV